MNKVAIEVNRQKARQGLKSGFTDSQARQVLIEKTRRMAEAELILRDFIEADCIHQLFERVQRAGEILANGVDIGGTLVKDGCPCQRNGKV